MSSASNGAAARRLRARLAIELLPAVLLVLGCAAALPGSAAAQGNPIQLENAKAGTTAWELPGETATSLPTPSTSILGYTSQISVQPGDVLQLHVSTVPAAPYRVEIYRLGWYGGTGGRLIGCLPACGASRQGSDWPVPSPDASTGYLDAGWPVTDVATVGTGWTSGYFVAKLILTGGPHSGQASWVPFLVRAPAATRSAILVQASVNTWEAYNNFGGKSLYSFNSSGPTVPASGTAAAAKVSFNRPFGLDQNAGPFMWEYQLVRFLERQGFDVTYQTDVDTDSNPASLLAHRLDVVSGHDEYWSPTMRDAYQAARAAGVNLVFLGGNIGYWQARYEDSDRTLVEYRSATLDPDPNPAQKTVRFSQPPVNRPECELLGIGYSGGGTDPTDPPRSYAVTQAALSNPWFQGTGLSPGHTIFDSVGYEWDTLQPGCAVPPLQVLLHFAGLTGVKGSPAPADAVTYSAPSGARVFSEGSMQSTWALDDFGHSPHADPGVQRLFRNILDTLGAFPASVTTLSTFVLVSPRAKAVLWNPRPRLSWKPSGDSAGPTRYLVMIDGKPAGSTMHTSYAPSRDLTDGTHTWDVVAVDRAGNQLAASPRTLIVRSVRLVRQSRRYTLAHGFRLLVYCAGRCSVHVRLALGRRGAVATITKQFRHGGIKMILVPLSPAFTKRLRSLRAAQLLARVKTHAPRDTRTVVLPVRW